LIFGLILIAATALLYLALPRSFPAAFAFIDKDIHAVTFIVLFIVMPLIGFPLNILLLLLGARFDPLTALLIMFGGMAVHQAIAFPAANTLLRPLIEKLLSGRNIKLPQWSNDGNDGFVWPSIIFMAVPGLTYAMKNYMLSLSGVPFRTFFLVSWLVQAVMGIPIVLAGESLAGRHFKLLAIVLALLGVLYVLRYWLVRWRGRKTRNLRSGH
jgi:uncharacterized membrane protein YdjX (TVP38/TMEM64 family)